MTGWGKGVGGRWCERDVGYNPASPIAKGYKRSGSLSGLKCNNRATRVVNETGKTDSVNVVYFRRVLERI